MHEDWLDASGSFQSGIRCIHIPRFSFLMVIIAPGNTARDHPRKGSATGYSHIGDTVSHVVAIVSYESLENPL